VSRVSSPRRGAGGFSKNELKLHLQKQWCVPSRASAEFVWRMEDVLEVYIRPYRGLE